MKKTRIAMLLKALTALAAVVFAAGCASTPVPPAYNLYNLKKIAVVPFENSTKDPLLGKVMQEEMLGKIVSLNAVTVIDANQVASYLKSIKAAPADVITDDAVRQKVFARYKCDLILTGSCEGYQEFLKDEAPKRVTDSQTNQSEWGFYTNRKVVVDAICKLSDADGGVAWMQKGNGYSWNNTWNPLPIPGNVAMSDDLGKFIDLANLVKNRVMNKEDKEPLAIDGNPDGAHIYPKSTMFAGLRGKAISECVNSMVRDFRGYNGWTNGGR